MGFNTSYFPFYPCFFRDIPQKPLIAFARKKNSQSEPVLNPSIIEEVAMDVDEDDDGIEDDIFLDGIFCYLDVTPFGKIVRNSM